MPTAFPLLRERLRSAATGALERNEPGHDRLLLNRGPVRASDSLSFLAAKLPGVLGPERAYGRIGQAAKCVGAGGAAI